MQQSRQKFHGNDRSLRESGYTIFELMIIICFAMAFLSSVLFLALSH